MHGLNLYDYSARYYEPAIGRFTTVDPHAENYYSSSPYAYVLNNPLKYIDPDGRDPISPAITLYRAGKSVYKTYKLSKAAKNAQAVQSASIFKGALRNYNHFVDGDRSEEVANSLIERGKLVDNRRAKEGYKEQKKRERASQKEDAEITKNHSDNMSKNAPDGSGNSKRPLKPGTETVIGGGVSLIAIIEYLANPDPSKDAHEAHLERVQNQEPGLIKRFINWLKDDNEDEKDN